MSRDNKNDVAIESIRDGIKYSLTLLITEEKTGFLGLGESRKVLEKVHVAMGASKELESTLRSMTEQIREIAPLLSVLLSHNKLGTNERAVARIGRDDIVGRHQSQLNGHQILEAVATLPDALFPKELVQRAQAYVQEHDLLRPASQKVSLGEPRGGRAA